MGKYSKGFPQGFTWKKNNAKFMTSTQPLNRGSRVPKRTWTIAAQRIREQGKILTCSLKY